VDVLEKRMNSLLAQNRRERSQLGGAKETGSGVGDVTVPIRFTYQIIKSLDAINKQKQHKNLLL
jgi:hypothetical protein